MFKLDILSLKYLINKQNFFFFSNEIITKLFPFVIFAVPYFYFSKKYSGEISYNLSIFAPFGVYLIGNLRQESIKNRDNLNEFINEKLFIALTVGVSVLLISKLFFFTQIPLIMWKTSDVMLEIILLNLFHIKKYVLLLVIGLIKITIFLAFFFFITFLDRDKINLLFYFPFLGNIILIGFLSQNLKFDKNQILKKNLLKSFNVFGTIALIDSVVVQIPKYFLKIDKLYSLIADFTIYFYFIFPLGILMESLSIIMIKNHNVQDTKSNHAYYFVLLISSLLSLSALFIIYYFKIFPIDFLSGFLCLIFGILNYFIMHATNRKLIHPDSSFKMAFPHMVYIIFMIILCNFNIAHSLHIYFGILIISCIAKGITTLYVD